MEILAEEPVTDAEVKEVLEKREKEAELKYEQKNALEILRKFVVFSAEKTRKIVSDLLKIEKLRDKQVVAIANLLPEDKDDLRAILQKEYVNFTEDEISLILDIVKKA